jgi:hypothetical protein
MNNMNRYTDINGSWVIFLGQFSLGIDYLAYLIYSRDRAAAFVSIPILLTWQAVVFFYVFRIFLPAYSSLANSEHSKAYIHLVQIALTLPFLVAIVVWVLLLSLSPSSH